MTPQAFRKLALSMPEAHEEPHFDRTSFRVKKKIFATMVPDGSEAMVRVHPVARVNDLLAAQPEIFFDYGKWTWNHGALGIRLPKVHAATVRTLMTESWRKVTAKKAPRGERRRPPSSDRL